MIIEKLVISNLFSYYGSVEFDLTPQDDRPITVILGRNGFGKTSFINSIKLLFVGVTRDIRSDVERYRLPSYRQYIEGGDSEWLGIRNRNCRNTKSSCGVEALWTDEFGRVSAKRQWQFNENNQFQEEVLHVDHPVFGVLEGLEAQKYLDTCLPEDYVPFFFFDGEELEELAESNKRTTIERMEQLLNIKSIDNLREALKKLMSGWRSDAMNQTAKAELLKRQNKQAEYHEEQQGLQQQLEDVKSETKRLEYDIKDFRNKISSLSYGGAKNKEVEYKAKLEDLSERQIELRSRVSEFLGNQPFLLALPDLVEQSISECESILNNKAIGHQELMESLRDQVGWALTQPPHSRPMLTPDQIKFYRDKLNSIIDLFKPKSDDENLYNMDSSSANGVLEILRPFSKNNQLVSSVARDMSSLQEITLNIAGIEKELLDVSHLSDEEQRRVKQYQAGLDQKMSELHELDRTKRDVEDRLSILSQYISKAESEIREAYNKVEISTAIRQRLDVASSIERALGDYKSALKSQRREELERMYNEKFDVLMDSHGLIKKVVVDEEFNTSYYAEDGESIGLSSISAGMKQLSATALIWALGDISGKDVPVVIDTPLGRIDRLHQINLLKKYYPFAGKQVILLPTDSELDEKKYDILEPYISRMYMLRNPSGDQTSIHLVDNMQAVYG